MGREKLADLTGRVKFQDDTFVEFYAVFPFPYKQKWCYSSEICCLIS